MKNIDWKRTTNRGQGIAAFFFVVHLGDMEKCMRRLTALAFFSVTRCFEPFFLAFDLAVGYPHSSFYDLQRLFMKNVLALAFLVL